MKRNSGTAASSSRSDSSSSSINREYDTALTRSGRPARNVNRKRTNGLDFIVDIEPEQQKRQIEVGKSGLAMTSLNSADRTGGKAGKNKKGENPHFRTMDSYLENKSSSSISSSAGGVGGGRSSRESYSDSCEIDMDGAKGYTHTDSSPKLNGQVEELYGIQLAPRAGDGIQWRKNPSTDVLDLT